MAGIVRKIDELGRIVIPKEIRKTLRIKDGESLEILCLEEGILLKKYSEIKDFKDLAKKYLEILSRYISYDILISDRDNYFTGSGTRKKEYVGKRIGPFFEKMIEQREHFSKCSGELEISEGIIETGNFYVASIHEDGDILGFCLVFFEEDTIPPEKEVFLRFVTDLLTKHIEE